MKVEAFLNGCVIAEEEDVISLQSAVTRRIRTGDLPKNTGRNYVLRRNGHEEPLITWEDAMK